MIYVASGYRNNRTMYRAPRATIYIISHVFSPQERSEASDIKCEEETDAQGAQAFPHQVLIRGFGE